MYNLSKVVFSKGDGILFSGKVLSFLSCLTTSASLFSLAQSGAVSAAAKSEKTSVVNREVTTAINERGTEPNSGCSISENQLEIKFNTGIVNAEKNEFGSDGNKASNKEGSEKSLGSEELNNLQKNKGIVCFAARPAENRENQEANFLFSILLFLLLLPFRLAFSLVWNLITGIFVATVVLPFVLVFCVLTFLIDGSDDVLLVKSKRSLVFMWNFLVSLFQGIRNGELRESLKKFSEEKFPDQYSGFVGRSMGKVKEFIIQNISKFFKQQ